LGIILKGINNALRFDRTTGYPEENLAANGEADFFLFTDDEGENLYITNTAILGGTDNNVITDMSQHIDSWLDFKDAPGSENYIDTVKLERDKVYHFMTADSFYGKFAVEGEITSQSVVTLGEGDALKVYLRYAFQTAQHVGHY
jgi:hypothetical protein